MVDLLLTVLAVLWAWEYLLILSPLTVPVWLQPLVVAAFAVGAGYVPQWIVTACAVAGAVALLHHRLVSDGPLVIDRRGRRGVTRL